MRDVHALVPSVARFDLHQVGISGVRKPIAVRRLERAVTLAASFDIAVDLPPTRKGSDLSRSAIVLAEVVDATVTRPVPSLEAACVGIARELLARHEYATTATVRAEAEYFLRRGIAPERMSLEDYRILADAVCTRSSPAGSVSTTESIGAEAVGMTACPCAMETARDALAEEFPLLRDPALRDLPMVTHNQRNRTRLQFDLGEGHEVEVDRILAVIEAAQSSPTYAILKRGDEARMVIAAHRRPRFVEDVLRDLLHQVASAFPELPDSTVARARTVSEESIHKYDVVAEHRATLGEIRRIASE